ncbi:cyclin-B1-5-like [Hordeum vulgare subsp. vulgare]|uniref:Cyclin N-terminal domain-containing protein n=1 Tax=Hordeum vulgare subsp. vulgare TaxID=112509 RepID=A0A8I6X7N3_HORVV|nr:cyclin-B1-5-like [Hordeum vulgare subsp. vulgare]
MATIHDQHAAAAPQPANRGAAGPAGKQKGAAAYGRVAGGNRRVLGDIGNVVHANVLDGKIELPAGINRPITRSFGAQLLKNAEPSKNGLAVPPAARAALKPVARKVPVKPAAPRPEPAAKIVTASDENRKPSEGGAPKISRKKAVHTLTTVLNHRSKEACVHDIDKLDSDNELAVVDYIDDIYKYYKVAQHECRPIDYMGSQPEISPKMRAILTDWLVEVTHKFELMPESLYLTMYAIDRFLSLQAVPRRELQLVGMAAMLIACKYEEIWAPEVNDFISIADNAYSRQQVLSMEKNMLNSMEWNLTVPTPYVFLVRFAKAAGSDKELEEMIFFFAEMALMEYGLVTARPSLVAASAVYAARCTLKRSPIWTETLKHHTGLTEAQLLEPARVLVMAHATAPESKLKAIYRKYSSEQYGRVALRPPAVAAPQRLA